MDVTLSMYNNAARAAVVERRRPALPPLVAADDGLGDVEQLMLDLARGPEGDRLGDMVREHLASGGKRLRARLALAATEALGAARSRSVGFAAACELLHNASLIHDDLQDGDTVRRDRPTLWVRYGAAQAVNAGDLCLMLPFTACEYGFLSPEVRAGLMFAVARHAADTVRGQAAELALLGSRRFAWSDWMAAAAGKTGPLFALPVEGAALIAGLGAQEARTLGDIFVDAGVLFQLQDDVLDLYGNKGRGFRGGDLVEGRVSALVVEHLLRRPAERDDLVALLDAPREHTDLSRVDMYIERFVESGALSGVVHRIVALRSKMLRSPRLAAHPALREILEGLVELFLDPVRRVIESGGRP